VQEVEETMGIPVASIIRLEDLIAHLAKVPDKRELLDSMVNYRQLYGT
jgi:orotate phosphoribosyltransferase